jgi:SAM-dependent methyltransferase
MYRTLAEFHENPEPFSRYTSELLWTDPHIAQKMLSHHLDPTTDLASRRPEIIDGVVDWIDRRFGLANKSVCDLGCGAGLYATRMARLGANVSGVDFSLTSINHAKADATSQGLSIEYRTANYLSDDLPHEQDIVTLIYGDLCALSPAQRNVLYARVWDVLSSGGYFVFDVFSVEQFAKLEAKSHYCRYFMEGFWSGKDYFGFLRTVLYDREKVSLDRYLIIEPDRCFEVCNWLQYFDPQTISRELRDSGFEVTDIVDVQTGRKWMGGARELAPDYAVLSRKP